MMHSRLRSDLRRAQSTPICCGVRQRRLEEALAVLSRTMAWHTRRCDSDSPID